MADRRRPPPLKLRLVETLDDLLDLREWFGERGHDVLGIDLETSGLNPRRDRIRTVQFGDHLTGWTLPWEGWRDAASTLIRTFTGRWAAHNALFESRFLLVNGVSLPVERLDDTMVKAHLNHSIPPHGLTPLSVRHLGSWARMGEDALHAAYRAGGWNFATVPVDFPPYWRYGALDAVLARLLDDELDPKITPFRQVYDIEMAAIAVLRDAELTGMKLDLDYCARTRAELEQEVAELAGQIPVKNPGADKQVREYLVGRGAPLVLRTESGALSVSEQALRGLDHERFPEAPLLARYRTCAYMLSNCFNGFERQRVGDVVHPSVKPVGARTARHSVTDPALQTLPRGDVVRNAFVAREGHKLILADYKQAELRVLAHFADEDAMKEVFARGDDPHAWLAEQVYHKARADVTADERQISKNSQYAKAYGAGDAQFAATARIPLEDASHFMRRYDELFPGVNGFMESTIQHVRETSGGKRYGWVESILGRHLKVEADEAYKGVNYIIQCSATADLTKLKLAQLGAAGLGEYVRLPVHDEILCEAPDDVADDVADDVREVLTETDLFSVPMEVDVTVADRWGGK